MKPKTYVTAGLAVLFAASFGLLYPAIGEFTGFYCVPRKLHDIRPPAESTSPEDVVRTYLKAIIARDIGTARRLSTSEFADREESMADSPFCSWTDLTAVTIHPAYPDVDGTGRYTTVMNVSVRLELKSHDRNAPYEYSWGYWLERDPPRRSWLIFESGEE
ncbi:hypothetical protein AB0H88_21330 [Nonomuraea sp. NPDC050680]|uniref:hypothetical protein n=1 Tax=Nonomuraea sp. NPDC050680 TaxID=3154630 RepID=UPI0033EB39F5